MAKPSQKVGVGLSIGRKFILPIVAVTANQSSALVATIPGIKSLNVLKGRKGIRPTLVQQEDDLLQWQLKKLITQAWCN
jgi:hypothetical protein